MANGDVQDYHDAKYSNVRFLSESGAIEVVRIDDDWTRMLEESEPTLEHTH